MTTLVSFLIVLGIMILIHEFGHFAVAKLSGVGVERFSLGFGPRLLKVKKGETEYCLSAIPFGGYVKMVGESSGEEVKDEDRSRSFSAKPILARVLIVAAGSIMNLVLALILFPLIFMMGIEVPAYLSYRPEVGHVASLGAAEKAGLKKGDVIEEVDGKAVKTWEGLYKIVAMSPAKPLSFKFRRDGTLFVRTMVPESSGDMGMGIGGFYPPMPARIGAVSKGYPAEKSGIKPDDLIKAVDGEPVTHWAEMQERVRRDGKEKTFLIEREGADFEVRMTPTYNAEAKLYLIGVMQREETVRRSYGFFESIKLGMGKAVELTVFLFAIIKGLIVGAYSIKSLGGPIMIAQVAGRAAESGVVDILSILAFLSLQLGIINLLPIPVLDGGHLFFFVIEWVRGRPLSERIIGIAQQVGMALLITLMVVVTWNDIMRFFD
ncbi:MAG: RIP metalloprotease RseP [Deltaproteobacteria bacterium]|nr:RIP metalloprotease RseP [Deltaproteobacteria bacterium]